MHFEVNEATLQTYGMKYMYSHIDDRYQAILSSKINFINIVSFISIQSRHESFKGPNRSL